mgnify:CR=1 FL=1
MKKLYLTAIMLFMSVMAFAQNPLFPNGTNPRVRVIIDNDLSGDPDGVIGLAHHLMCPSVDVRAVIGSYFPMNHGPQRNNVGESKGATKGAETAAEVVKLLGLEGKINVLEGSNTPMVDDNTPAESAGADFIVKEAMREDVKTPLFVCCGGSLNTIASAYLKEPRIAERLTLVWIGGQETLEELQIVPPGYSKVEYNLNLDIAAGRGSFNKSKIPMWNVPRAAYRLCLYSYAEMVDKMKPMGKIGEYLFDKIGSWFNRVSGFMGTAETYILGDSPLVLLTALQSIFEPDPSSSHYVVRQSPIVDENGLFSKNMKGRNIRVYDQLDTRLLFGDMESKLKIWSKK